MPSGFSQLSGQPQLGEDLSALAGVAGAAPRCSEVSHAVAVAPARATRSLRVVLDGMVAKRSAAADAVAHAGARWAHGADPALAEHLAALGAHVGGDQLHVRGQAVDEVDGEPLRLLVGGLQGEVARRQAVGCEDLCCECRWR